MRVTEGSPRAASGLGPELGAGPVGELDRSFAQALGSVDRLVVGDATVRLAGGRGRDQVEAGAVGVYAAGGGRLGAAADRPRHVQQRVVVVLVEVLDRARGAFADWIALLHG